MRPEVCREIGGLGECLAAYLAVVWLLTAVGAHVCLERGGAGVALATHLTDIAPRLARSSLWLGRGGMVIRLETNGRGPITDDCTGHREWKNVEGDWLHVVLVFW